MGHIKEPTGINFVVDPTPLSEVDKKNISYIIAHFKATGKKIKISKSFKKQINHVNKKVAFV